MSSPGLVLVVLSACTTACANLLLRAGLLRIGGFDFTGDLVKRVLSMVFQPQIVIGFALYALAVLLWFRVLSTEEISAAYPLLMSLTFILVTVGAILLFQERVTLQKLVGLGVILAGVVIVARV